MRGEDRVTLVFFGDGASEAGVLHESLNFASLKNLPVVFVCENNLYSVYSPLEVRQPVGRAIVDLARSHDIEAQQADGNDAELVYGLASEAIEAARRGDGPRFLEFSTYRWREHCGPSYDDQLGYRPAGELDAWRSHDPLHELRDRLLELRAVDEHSLTQLETKFQQEFESAVQFARTSPFPDVTRLNMDVYAEPIHESEARAA
jgi:pyruvate dehydrogenase E1 component alpha subunit